MADAGHSSAGAPQSDKRFAPIETENGYAVWDNIRDEIYGDDEGVSEEFTSRWQAEEYAHQPVSYTHLDVYKRQQKADAVRRTRPVPDEIWTDNEEMILKLSGLL